MLLLLLSVLFAARADVASLSAYNDAMQAENQRLSAESERKFLEMEEVLLKEKLVRHQRMRRLGTISQENYLRVRYEYDNVVNKIQEMEKLGQTLAFERDMYLLRQKPKENRSYLHNLTATFASLWKSRHELAKAREKVHATTVALRRNLFHISSHLLNERAEAFLTTLEAKRLLNEALQALQGERSKVEHTKKVWTFLTQEAQKLAD